MNWQEKISLDVPVRFMKRLKIKIIKYWHWVWLFKVWFCGAGGIDFKGFLLSVPKKDISRLAIWIFERMIRQIILVNNTNKPGEPRITNQTSIIDMEGMDKTLITNKKGAKCDRRIFYLFKAMFNVIKNFKYQILALDIALDQFKIMENYYPCLHRSVFIINGRFRLIQHIILIITNYSISKYSL